MTADIPMESKVVERQWNTTFQVLEGKKKKKTVNQEVYVLYKHLSKTKMKENHFQTNKKAKRICPQWTFTLRSTETISSN